MNILTWNCNMAFRKKFQEVISEEIDLVVIQECENQHKLVASFKDLKYNEIIWYGKNPNKGIAIISFNEAKIKLRKEFNEDFEYILPIELTLRRKKINLFAIWAMPFKNSPAKSYVGQIWRAVNYYEKLLEKNSILIGDFNSNSIWDNKRKVGNHSSLVELLNNYGIVSLHHHLKKEQHGSETEPTLYLLKQERKPFHIDYCFVPKKFISNKTNIQIGKYKDWITKSDHMPIWIRDLKI